MRYKNIKGFTLVELLIVIAIIGILAVVALPALVKNINKAKLIELESDYTSIKQAALQYYAEYTSLPPQGSLDVLSDYLEYIPKKSPIGNGKYSLITSDVAGGGSGSLYLVVGLKNENCWCGNDKEIHGSSIECYDNDKLINTKKSFIEKLYKDFGENIIFQFDGIKFIVISKLSDITENPIVGFKLIDDIKN
ncbi:type IV pilin protein [[Clostridium] dakarense]|uniref:type IV pilin protein n=1 Tax=Faecalimicrobium dakarense TaxID=1301100 RepID=UPI0004B48944|nr:type II secretion system protein [[Clostridium] dakarense]